MGCDDPPVLVECKRHTWIAGGNSPSAKLAVWNEAMYFFHLAGKKYTRILCVLHSTCPGKEKGRSLAEYYLDRYGHLVPAGVEIREFEERKGGLVFKIGH